MLAAASFPLLPGYPWGTLRFPVSPGGALKTDAPFLLLVRPIHSGHAKSAAGSFWRHTGRPGSHSSGYSKDRFWPKAVTSNQTQPKFDTGVHSSVSNQLQRETWGFNSRFKPPKHCKLHHRCKTVLDLSLTRKDSGWSNWIRRSNCFACLRSPACRNRIPKLQPGTGCRNRNGDNVRPT